MKIKMKMVRSFSSKTCLNMINNEEEEEEELKNGGSNRFIITVNVFGSAGPFRFIVNGNDHAERVIARTLKLYAREGRLPVLGSDTNCFLLYPANVGFNALNPLERIGSHGVRNFVLCKKKKPTITEGRSGIIIDANNKKRVGWRVWLQKSLSLEILPH